MKIVVCLKKNSVKALIYMNNSDIIIGNETIYETSGQAKTYLTELFVSSELETIRHTLCDMDFYINGKIFKGSENETIKVRRKLKKEFVELFDFDLEIPKSFIITIRNNDDDCFLWFCKLLRIITNIDGNILNLCASIHRKQIGELSHIHVFYGSILERNDEVPKLLNHVNCKKII